MKGVPDLTLGVHMVYYVFNVCKKYSFKTVNIYMQDAQIDQNSG